MTAIEQWEHMAREANAAAVKAMAEADRLRAELAEARAATAGWYCSECRYWAEPYQPDGKVELFRRCPNDAVHTMYVRTEAHIERDEARAELAALRAAGGQENNGA